MPLRRLQLPLLVVALLLGQAVTAPPLSAAGQRSTAPSSASSGLLMADDGREDRRGGSADLRYPAGPVGSYRPRFVGQTGKNCAFASAAMLLDKWTGGRQRPNQARLRLASRVPASIGVSFAELSRAVARVSGMDLRYSPRGGDPLTWNQLMSRLARGGGAVLGGAYSRLPRHYQRWARDFARQGARASGHAVYIERFVATRNGGRVWMMDPLAHGAGYRGEWISARALRVFAWRNSKGLVTAAATPEPPVLAGYQFAPVQAGEWLLAGGQVKLRLPFTTQAGWPKPPELSLVTRWQLLTPEPEREALVTSTEAGSPEAVTSPTSAGSILGDVTPRALGARSAGLADEASRDPGGRKPPKPPELPEPPTPGSTTIKLSLKDAELVGSVPAPAEPGLYRLEVELRRADGRAFPAAQAPQLAALNVRLRGELAAEFSLLPLLEPAQQGTLSRVQLEVVNRGSLDWLADEAVTLEADWQTSIGELPGGSTLVELAAGATGTFSLDTLVPTRVSEATLRVELFDAEGVPLAVYGAEPLLVWMRFIPQAGEDAAGPERPQ